MTGFLFSQGRHVRRHPVVSAVASVVMAAMLAMVTFLNLSHPATASASASYGGAALSWAESHAQGDWYEYGSTGPSTYDCSGLVMAAFEHVGLTLPRTTYGMLDSRHLVRTYHPERGDLAFFGDGHVEFVTKWYHTTFGAHDTGSRIGYIEWGGYWYPTAYYEVVG